MATPTINSTQFTTMEFPSGIPPVQARIEDMRRKGDDGDWSRIIGSYGEEFQIRTLRRCADAAAAQALIDTTYPALLTGALKTLATITDSDGRSWANVKVKSFQVVRDLLTTAVASSVAHSGNRIVEVVWLCQRAN